MARAAPSREPPSTSNDQEAGQILRLGDFTSEPTLSTSEARIILTKTLETRKARGHSIEEKEVLTKTVDYLEIFSIFKDLAQAKDAENVINVYGEGLERFEKSQMGSLVPTCADEARALIPSLETKIAEGLTTEDKIEDMCRELQKTKRNAQLQ